eukprot:13326709-Alexandrium_andersonii.AAC.1
MPLVAGALEIVNFQRQINGHMQGCTATCQLQVVYRFAVCQFAYQQLPWRGSAWLLVMLRQCSEVCEESEEAEKAKRKQRVARVQAGMGKGRQGFKQGWGRGGK